MFGRKLIPTFYTGYFWRNFSVSRGSTQSTFSVVTEEIRHAVQTGQPVVALESTLLTHGLPADKALDIGRSIETVIRENGAIPATVAVFDQRLHVGMSDVEFEQFIEATKSGRARKAALRDLPHSLTAVEARELVFGTTVSATAFAAHRAGIKIFATGGIGGVHRDGENTMDISSDLTALATIPVAVISAGVKSILDIPRTLEVLESKCVVVTSVGSDEFPAFFTRYSGIKSPCRINTSEEAAKLFATSLKLRPSCGFLVAVPIPDDMLSIGEKINRAIQCALDEAKEKNIVGSCVTPFVLELVRRLTDNESLKANVRLVLNNAKFAAQMSVHLSDIDRSAQKLFNNTSTKIVVVGGSNLDTIIRMTSNKIKNTQTLYPPASYPGTVEIIGGGGVGRNLAEVLARLSVPHVFCTALGQDTAARILNEQVSNINWKLVPNLPSASRTANYVGLLNATGELLFGVADMELHSKISTEFVRVEMKKLAGSNLKLICMDGNIGISTIRAILDEAELTKTPVWFEPTDLHKCTKIIEAMTSGSGKPIAVISPNLIELKSIYRNLTGRTLDIDDTSDTNIEKVAETIKLIIRKELIKIADNWFVKMGKYGVIFINEEMALLFASPVADQKEIISVSGAGDSCAGVIIYLRYLLNCEWRLSILGGLRAAQLSLKSEKNVSTELDVKLFTKKEIESWCNLIKISNI